MGFLREIVTSLRTEVRDPRYLEGLTDTPTRRRQSLRRAVEADASRGALLVEYKRTSPGQAEPRLPRRSVAEFLRATAAAPVSGYSCLATRPRFEGTPRDVAELARESPHPVLFKDFVIDPVQIDAAYRAGASAVLLIARLGSEGLLDRPLEELAEAAHARGLEVLLELHHPSELSATEKVAADMYGVNVRDLDTLRFERPTAEATLVAARAASRSPLLGLSGIESPADAARFWSAGADGVLVGTAVARSNDPVPFLRSLLRAGAGGRG